jgi:uncharacterized protein
MSNFTPWTALAGGALIGAAASFLLASTGRMAAVSGIIAGVADRKRDAAWRWFFLFGLAAVGLVTSLVWPQLVTNDLNRPLLLTGLGGLLVGLGARVGSGCTSGHGVCGISRGSARSVVATLTFMGTGVATAILARLLLPAQ